MDLYSAKYKYSLKVHAKSACSTLRSMFVDLHADELPPQTKRELNMHHNAQEMFVSHGEPPPLSINVIRDPCERVVSMFINKFCNKHKEQRVLSDKLKVTKSSFRNFVARLEDLHARGELNSFDIHVEPQSQNHDTKDILLIADSGLNNRLVEFYSKHERLSPLGPKAKLFLEACPEINVSSFDRADTLFCGDRVWDIDSAGPWPPACCWYDEPIRQCIRKIYGGDFLMYNAALKLDVNKDAKCD